jgi:hypothetical protein
MRHGRKSNETEYNNSSHNSETADETAGMGRTD